jgi:lipopolysaccharide transport system ATP-binding protein
MSPVISIENLSKKYIIRHQKQERYTALRDVLANGAKRFAHKLAHPFAAKENDPTNEEFWALKDVSFEIKQGDRVGIIGRNGAGKSTLLKILSRITEPTSGRAAIKGRVVSLLEVGTGFHPELTGRENIFLNGAILGMSKVEINKKFDQIVAFGEVEKFLDTPVKRYSSGMYVRLAFAVAAHLESDILIVDEVLAVGDAGFQKKCMGRMEAVSGEGRTVLFVSHNMGAVAELCTRAVLLHQGKIILDGTPSEVINEYMSKSGAGTLMIDDKRDVPIFVTEINLYGQEGIASSSISIGLDAVLEIKYSVKEPLANVTMAMMLSRQGSPLLYSYDNDIAEFQIDGVREVGEYTARINLPLSRFKEGQYAIEAKIGVGQTNMTNESAVLVFEICNYSVNTMHKSYKSERPGHLYWPLSWDTRKL